MKYKNNTPYNFEFDGVRVEVAFVGLTDEVVNKFNKVRAEEKVKAYHRKHREIFEIVS